MLEPNEYVNGTVVLCVLRVGACLTLARLATGNENQRRTARQNLECKDHAESSACFYFQEFCL